jgi:hypothetical protein
LIRNVEGINRWEDRFFVCFFLIFICLSVFDLIWVFFFLFVCLYALGGWMGVVVWNFIFDSQLLTVISLLFPVFTSVVSCRKQSAVSS